MSATDCQSLSIAIVGAGPGGLTLARLLQRKGINATVFERTVSRDVDPQGRSLDLHPESGLPAIREADLMNEFLVYARYDGEDMRFVDKTGKVHFSDADMPKKPEVYDKPEDNPDARPEIDRMDLRAILLDSLSQDTVKWSHPVESVNKVEDSDHKHTLTFANGSTETFDLIIGADGAWSSVRPLLTPAKPAYSGITFIDVSIPDIDHRFPALSAVAGHGTVHYLSHNKGIITQRQSRGILRIYIAVRIPETWAKSFKPTREAILELFNDGWSPDILEYLRSYDESSLVVRRLNSLPTATTWETHPGLALIGDAAHLMVPNGEGVNQAMLDALELSRVIVDITEGKISLHDGVKQYEEPMFKRTAGIGKMSDGAFKLFFEENAPVTLVEKFKYFVVHGNLPQ